MYYIYILYSSTSDLYYTGSTEDFFKRLSEHNESDNDTFTSKHRPWVLKGVFECGPERKNAMLIERFIKKQKSRSLIEYILRGEQLTGILAQLVRVPHVRD
jgi:putative endonuclease